MPKETLQLHNLDKGIEEKYGSVENFVEEGQENKIEESITSVEEVETIFKNVQEKADKDGRSDKDKKTIDKALAGFDATKNKISQKERLERDGFNEKDRTYSIGEVDYKMVKMGDGSRQHWQQKENGDYFLKKMVEGGTVTEFDKAGEIIQQKNEKGEVIEGANNIEQSLSNNQQRFNEPADPDNYIRIQKNDREMKLLEEDAKDKFKAMNALAHGSPERDQAYSAWKSATEKVRDRDTKEPGFITSRDLNNISLENETKNTYTKDGAKKLEIKSQQNSSPKNDEKVPLARAIEQDEILKRGNEKVEEQVVRKPEKEITTPYRSIRDEFTAEQGALSKEMNRQENSWLSKKFTGMRDRVGNLKKSLYEKNPKLGKVLGVVGDKYSQFNRWMNKGNQTQRILKRIAVSGTLGALTGGVSFGITAARVVGSAAAGAGAGLAHKWYTNKNFDKNLNRNQENLKESYYREVAHKQGNEYTVENPETNKTFSIRDRENLTSLRSKKEQGTITKGEASQLAMLEATRKSLAEDLLKSRSEYRAYKEGLKDKLIQKNERNNQLVSAAAGLVTGLSMRFGPELWDSLTNHPEVPEVVPTVSPSPEPLPEPVPKVIPDPIVTEHIVSGDAFINKGEGITHALARQINASPELQAAFGLDGPANGQELAEIAKKLGYINEDGSDVRVMMGHGAAYELRIDPNTGEPFVMEYKGGELEGGNYVGGEEVEKHMQGENFEAKARDSYEYIHDGSPQSASSGTERVNFSAKEMYPDIDFDSDVNPRIPNATDIEPQGPIGANGEELVRNSQTSTPESGVRQSVTENTPATSEKRILLQQQAAGIEIRHTTQGTELHPIEGFKFTGEIEKGDFSPRELRLLDRGIKENGYQIMVNFDPSLKAPFAGSRLIQLKNGQYALEKVSFGLSGAEAQTEGEKGMRNIMKVFGMPGKVEHFGPMTMPKTNIYESHAYIPLSDEQAKFIRESYATLGRALTNVPR